MNTFLYYFFEYAVFFFVIFPLVNEIVFILMPNVVLDVRGLLREDVHAARQHWFMNLQGASGAITIAGLFTSQGFLFAMYFLSALVPLILEKFKPGLRESKTFVRIDGFVCLLILSSILGCRIANISPFDILFQFYIGDGPPEAPAVAPGDPLRTA